LIGEKVMEALKPGQRGQDEDGELARLLTASAKKKLLQEPEFKPASHGSSGQPELRRGKLSRLNLQAKGTDCDGGPEQGAPSKQGSDCAPQDLGDGIPAPQEVLFPAGRLSMTWERVYPVGAGLDNLGNTCFLNSTLQCLTYTPPLASYLLSKEHSQTCQQKGFCMMCVMENHTIQAFANSGNAIKPVSFIRHLKHIAQHICFGRQEDAHEFLRYTVDAMQQACLNGCTKLDRQTQATTMVHQIFGGYLRSRVECSVCKGVSDTYDPFLDLALEIEVVRQALQPFPSCAVRGELGSSQHLPQRDLCLGRVRPPPSSDGTRWTTGLLLLKQESPLLCSSRGILSPQDVPYPEFLNVRPYMSQKNGDPVMYGLYAVLVHSGYSCHSGHYYCHVKASNGRWYQMDDDLVCPSSIKVVLKQKAYVLFYLR
ncbi:UBP36 hydrolase, partial [Lophotis ruficrista]|nr:UBP36 hydrolase [Lophotis ruficrista]